MKEDAPDATQHQRRQMNVYVFMLKKTRCIIADGPAIGRVKMYVILHP